MASEAKLWMLPSWLHGVGLLACMARLAAEMATAVTEKRKGEAASMVQVVLRVA